MLNLITIIDEPGRMLSKTGKKLNFEFANVARHYGQTSFLRNQDSCSKLKEVEVRYPKRLLDTQKEAKEPFKLLKGRDLNQEAKNFNSRAPPVGTYHPRRDIKIKTWRIYAKENPLADTRDTFMKLKSREATPVKVDTLAKKIYRTYNENTTTNKTKTNPYINSSMMQSSMQNAHPNPDNNKEPKAIKGFSLTRKGTVNYWDQFKHDKEGVGLIDFDRQFVRSQTAFKGYREFDLKQANLDALSNYKKSATDIYFFSRTNFVKKQRTKFVKKMNFYNVKMDIVKPKLVRNVPVFGKEVGRRPLSVGTKEMNHNFYDYVKLGPKVPVFDFDKQLKF